MPSRVVNPLRSCDTGRDKQTELLVVFEGERDPLVEKRSVDRPLARLDFTPKRPQQDTLDIKVCPARLFGEVAGEKIRAVGFQQIDDPGC